MSVLAILAVRSSFGFFLLPGFTLGFLGGLVLLALDTVVLQDEGAELETWVNARYLATCLAVQLNVSLRDFDCSLGILALPAKNEFGNEAIEVVL